MLESDVAKKIRCFVCGDSMPVEDIVVVGLNDEDMVCVCRNHIKSGFQVPFERAQHEPIESL